LIPVLDVRRRRGVSFPQWEEKKGRKEVKKLLKTKNITISVPKTESEIPRGRNSKIPTTTFQT